MSGDFSEQIKNLEEKGRLRSLNPLEQRQGCKVSYQGREFLNLTSNDYLGLAANRALLRQFYQGLDADGSAESYALGCASSRLLSGDTPLAHELEQCLAESYDFPGCLLFNSGYHANIGILPALCGKGDLVLSDKLNHASIHDGLKLTAADHKRFNHGDMEQLGWLLEKHRDQYDRVVIVSESVFSMDGDVADLGELVELKKQYRVMLYLDEAHGIGVHGQRGLGLGEATGLLHEIDLFVATFGKALGAAGAFVLCSREIRQYLINHCRSLIFSTILPPVVLNWNLFVFKQMMEMTGQREHLAELAGKLRKELVRCGLQTRGATNIVPVLLGEDRLAVQLAEQLRNEGYLIFPVRPPAVPEGSARFRLSLTADMSWQDLAGLPTRIAELKQAL